MARRKKEPTIKELQAEVRKDVKQWNRVKKYGSDEPFDTDGTSLWLIRNHISFDRAKLLERCKADGVKKCPKESRVKLPKQVGWNYCAPKSKSGACKERRRKRRKKAKRRTPRRRR